MPASMMPGIIAAANRSVTGICSTGPITTSMIEGGIRMPSVPPAVMANSNTSATAASLRILCAKVMPPKPVPVLGLAAAISSANKSFG